MGKVTIKGTANAKDILCLKVMDATSNLVLEHQLYYSEGKPDAKKFKQVKKNFILGEAENKQIPLLGICDVDICDIGLGGIHQAFQNCAEGHNWKYQWSLQDLQKPIISIPEIRAFVSTPHGDDDIQAITSLQNMVYIDSKNLAIPQIKISSGSCKLHIGPNKAQIINKDASVPISEEKPTPLQEKYSLGEYLEIKVKGTGLKQGKIVGIQESTDKGVVIDQTLTIEVNEKRKCYSATALRKLKSKWQ